MVKVKEIMKRDVVTCGPDVTISHVARVMSNNKIGSVVVVEDEKPIGIVTDSDIVNLVARGRNPKEMKVKDLEMKKLITMNPEENMLEAAKIMVENDIKRIPIVENEKLVGIVSEKDILVVSPEIIEVLSEKLKMKVEGVRKPDEIIEGVCENCGGYSEELKNVNGIWLCEECRES